jgi:hypothetical protein
MLPGQFIFSQVFFRIDRLPVNTLSYSEMAPSIFENGIIFCSNRKQDVIVVTVDQEGEYMYNLYFTGRKGKSSWTRPVLFSKELVSRYHQSSASVSADGNTVYYTSTINSSGKIGDKAGADTLNGILISARADGKWQTPKEFSHNSDEFNVGFPCISSDGNRLFFSARDPEGFGGYDIYYCDRNGNQWSDPVNIGEKINTEGNEIFPFLFKENRLYFSSDGHAGEGNIDIYYSEFLNGSWSNAVNMPAPFNSGSDDFAFVANAEMDTGYFTSNRRGTDDIYQFVSTFPTFTECPEQVEESYCYEFYEAGLVNLDTTSLKYEWDLGDGAVIRKTRVVHCYEEPGYYFVQLNVVDTLTGEISRSEAVYDLLIEKMEQPYMVIPDTAGVNENIVFDASQSHINKFTIENYYWDFGDGSMTMEKETTHSYTRPGVYIVRLGLRGADENEPDKIQEACSSKQIVILER